MAGLFLLAFFSGYFVVFPITDTDIWWHLAAGRAMAQNHAWLHSDIFSRISFGTPWIDVHWGFQWLVYRIWLLGQTLGSHAGEMALVFSKALWAGSLAALCWWPAFFSHSFKLKERFWVLAWAMPWALALGYFQRYLTDIRPLWITLIAISIQYALVRLLENQKINRLSIWMGIGLCQLIMANIQGLFLLGPLMLTAFCFGENLRLHREVSLRSIKDSLIRLPWLFLLALLTTNLLNPYGWNAFQLATTIATRIIPSSHNVFSSEMSENISLWSSLLENPSGMVPLITVWMIGLCVALISFKVEKHRYWGEAIVHAGSGVLACMALRNVPLALVSLAWWLARIARNLNIAQWTWHKYAVVGGWLCFLPFTVFMAKEIRASQKYELPGTWITPFRLPLGAIDYLQAHPIPGQMFNELRHGGFLVWTFSNPSQNFIDGRMVLRTGNQYREVLNAFDHPESFESLRQRYGITHVLLPLIEWERYRGLGEYLLRNQTMQLAYCDGATALLIQTELAKKAYNSQSLEGFPVVHQFKEIDEAIQNRFSTNPLLRQMAQRSAKDFLRNAHWKSSSDIHGM